MSSVTIVRPTPSTAVAQPSARAARQEHPTPASMLLVDNGKPKAGVLLRLIAGQLEDLVGPAAVETYRKQSAARPLTAEEADAMASRTGLALTGVGDCGACSACSIHDAIELEKRGVPAVAVITEPFQALAASFATRLGMADIAFVVIPHPVASREQLHLAAHARGVAGAVRDHLVTAPAGVLVP